MEPITETPQKHFVNRVTPFSKALALILFVTLPLLTLYLGYKIGTDGNVSPDPLVVEEEQGSLQRDEEQNRNEPGSIIMEETSSWETFENTRDGYTVRYPGENIAGTPKIGSGGSLIEYGFNDSLTFESYGGWADIYLFSGTEAEAVTSYKKFQTSLGREKIYKESDVVIGGKQAKALVSTIDGRSEYRYFVEYRPGKVLFIAGPMEFAYTLTFI